MVETDDGVDVVLDDEASPDKVEKPVKDAKKPEPPKKDDIVVEAAEAAKPKAPDISPEEGIKILNDKLKRERDGRLAAEQRAQQEAARANQASQSAYASNVNLVDQAISMVKQDTAVLKAKYKEAMAAGDFDTVADIQESMGSNAAKLLQLENGKSAMEQQAKRPPPQQQHRGNPVDQLAAQLSPRSADWVRAHPEFVTNPRMYQKMLAAHNLVTSDGVEPDTDDYFNAVEKILIPEKPAAHVEDVASEAAKPVQRRSSPPAAPVSRSGTGDGSRPNVVRLTAEEREIAQMTGMTDQDYARQKIKIAGSK